MARRNCPTGCAMGLPSNINLTDKTVGKNRTVKTQADLAGAKPVMTDKTGCLKTALKLNNPLNGKK